MNLTEKIFSIRNENDFLALALEIFHRQFDGNRIYRQFVNSLAINPARVTRIVDIPFLPVEFFKTQKIITGNAEPQKIFLSSGTTGLERSRHEITDISLYRESLLGCFEFFYGYPANYEILALTPSPSETPDSSLVYMIQQLISLSGSDPGNYFLNREGDLFEILRNPPGKNKQILLIGLTYALMDFAGHYPGPLPGVIIMETGGMKGKKEEITREELHDRLCLQFGVHQIHSEYGMTELLSQAYSAANGIFKTPEWMRILIRDPEDPMRILGQDETGGINIIDLANVNSCSFISTKDIGRLNRDGTFEVYGRFDFSDIRGCSLMGL